MRIIVHFSAEVQTVLGQEFFERIAEETLKRCGLRTLESKGQISLTAVAVSSEKIQTLNKEYRKKDQVTDILSFGEYVDTESVMNDTGEELFLGELFFCQEVIARAAQEDGVTLEHELIYVFSHGVLHLLGYDHSEEMFAIQDAVTEYLIKESLK